MKCERCGERGLLKSDLIGDLGCVSCYGNKKDNYDTCVDCGKTNLKSGCASTGGFRCWDCYRKYVSEK